MRISKRSHKKELIDLGDDHYTKEEYQDCLNQLDRINRFLGGDRATYRSFDLIKTPPLSILDVGCGGGLFTLKLAKRYPFAKVIGIDISRDAIEIAKANLHNTSLPPSNVEFHVPSSPELAYPEKSFDIITSTLVCHHLDDDQLISFLKNGVSIARKAVIINDLHRHPLATCGYALAAPLFFRNRLVIHDGFLSIKRGFTRKDWMAYLSAAGIPAEKVQIHWNWAFRWTVTIHV